MARRLGVTRDDVVHAAVRVADRDGLDALTVAAVATEVGCRPPSVYHHVDGLEGLHQAVALVGAAQLAEGLTVAARGRSGVEALRAMSRIGRTWARAHRGRFAALCQPVSAEQAPELAAARRAVLDPARRALTAAGVTDAGQATWLTALVAAVRGTVAVDAAGEPGDAEARDRAHDLLVGVLLDELARRTEDDPAVAGT